MAILKCSISGQDLKVSHVPMTLPAGSTAHPIFYLQQKHLLSLYQRYTAGKLNKLDSYFLFLALLHNTDKVLFESPARYRDNITDKIIANNIDKLVTVIWKSDAISHPSFKQPKKIISDRDGTDTLNTVSQWITIWENNLHTFSLGRNRAIAKLKLDKVEAKLSKVILSGTSGRHLAVAVATWAAIAGDFPENKAELWKTTIRKCFNKEAMFSTPPALIKEIKNYCEENIEAGSIHFHSLMKVLRRGKYEHDEYLGLGIKTKGTSYTLLDDSEDAVLELLAKAPVSEPLEKDYPSRVEYLRARLNYQVYTRRQKQGKIEEDSEVIATEGVNINV